METFKIGILEPDNFSPKAISRLKEIGVVTTYQGDGSKADIKAYIADKNALFVRLKYQIDQELVDEATGLKYICSPTTGLNHISITSPDIMIISLKGEYGFLETIRATPEHVFGITLSLLRNYSSAFIKSEKQEWNRDVYRGYELYGAKIGIIGLGRIGRLLVRYFTAFDANVGYYDIQPKDNVPEGIICFSSLEDLIDNSEIVILEANYTPGNDKMITADLLRMMKGKYFINAARGELVDEEALIDGIKRNIYKGVAVDTFANEAKGGNLEKEFVKLTQERNLIVTPHIGGATYTSMMRTEEYIANKMANLVQQERYATI